MNAFKSTLFLGLALAAAASATSHDPTSSDSTPNNTDSRLTQRYSPPCGWTFNTQIRGGYTTYTSSFIAGDASTSASDGSINSGPLIAFSQSIGYKDWLSLRIAGKATIPYTSPDVDFSQSDGYLANAEALLSVPFVANRESSLVFMPSIGFGWTQEYQKISSSDNLKQQIRSRYFAPSVGLLVGFMPAPAMTIHGGIFFAFPTAKHKASLNNPDDPIDNYAYPYTKLRRRRHGINAELEMAYKIKEGLSIVTKSEWNTLSVEGHVTSSAGPTLSDVNTAVALQQFAVSMGVDFSY